MTRRAAHRVNLESSCSSFNHARWKPTGVTLAYRTTPEGVSNEDYLDFPRQITETLATTDGATGTFVHTLANSPVLQLVAIRNGAVVIPVTVNESGDVSGTGITAGTLDPATGALSITFGTDPADGTVVAADYLYSENTDTSFLIFAENPGTWGNSIKVQVKEVLWEPEAFEIVVFESIDGVDIRRESFICARTHRKDGHGTQMFLEDRVNNRSSYIRVVNNPEVADNVMPAFWTSAQNLVGGTDGSPVADGDISLGWQMFKNPAEVDMNILINAGYVSSDTFAVQTTLQALAETRRDCFAILDIPYDQTKMFPTTDARDWRLTTQNINSSFTALYAPWIYVYDTYNDTRNLPVPPSGFVAQVFARTDWTRESWYAPAGFNRGVLRSQTLPPMDVTERYGVPGVIHFTPRGV